MPVDQAVTPFLCAKHERYYDDQYLENTVLNKSGRKLAIASPESFRPPVCQFDDLPDRALRCHVLILDEVQLNSIPLLNSWNSPTMPIRLSSLLLASILGLVALGINWAREEGKPPDNSQSSDSENHRETFLRETNPLRHKFAGRFSVQPIHTPEKVDTIRIETEDPLE